MREYREKNRANQKRGNLQLLKIEMDGKWIKKRVSGKKIYSRSLNLEPIHL